MGARTKKHKRRLPAPLSATDCLENGIIPKVLSSKFLKICQSIEAYIEAQMQSIAKNQILAKLFWVFRQMRTYCLGCCPEGGSYNSPR